MDDTALEDHVERLEPGLDLDELSRSEHQKVLIVEDDPDTIQLLKMVLRNAGYHVLSATSGGDAIRKVTEMQPDIVLLDLMMPEMDGWQTYNYIRQMTDLPVIIVSAVGAKDEIVKALQIGVDDYITKPFVNAEVVARIQAVLRRSARPKEIDRLVFPKLEMAIYFDTQEVVLKNQTIHLTPKELAVLKALAKAAPGTVSYPIISQAVWGEDSEDARKRTKYLIYLLRRKFDRISPGMEVISNIDRLGYKLLTE